MHGNALDERVYDFSVTNETDPGKILHWRLEDLGESFQVDEYLALGASVSLRGLANTLYGKSTKRLQDKARKVADAWQRAGLVEIIEPDVKGKALNIFRIEVSEGDSGDDVPF